MAPIDLDAVQARSDAAVHHEGESNGYVLSQRWYVSAVDVPALIAELRAARETIEESLSLAENLLHGWSGHVPRDVTAGHARLVELLGGGS